MLNVKLISLKGTNYFFSNNALFGLEENVFYQIDYKTNFKRTPLCFGGVVAKLYNGKKLYFVDKYFYVKEWKMAKNIVDWVGEKLSTKEDKERNKRNLELQSKLKENLASERDKYFKNTVGDTITTDLSIVTDDEIKDLAERFYKSELNNKRGNLKSNFTKSVNSANSVYDKEETSLADKLNKVAKAFKEDLTNARENSLKNNVARSSISNLKEQNLQDEASNEEKQINDSLVKAKVEKDEKIENAQKTLSENLDELNSEYNKLIWDKRNELKKIKDKNSSYSKSLVNREALNEYEDNAVELVKDYINEVGIINALRIFGEEGFLKDYLTSDLIDRVLDEVR